jgi:uncharacterized membrane protein
MKKEFERARLFFKNSSRAIEDLMPRRRTKQILIFLVAVVVQSLLFININLFRDSETLVIILRLRDEQ